jgi:hypothetical protein
MEEITLSNDKIQALRRTGVLSENEVAAQSGDLIVAINVVTQERRVITIDSLSESAASKRLLKG